MDSSGELKNQITIEQTVDRPLREVWDFLISKSGLELWLGTSQLEKWETGIAFTTRVGINGVVRVFSPYSHIRLSWQPSESQGESIVQMRVFPLGGKTKIQIHQEKLADRKQKERMEGYWEKVFKDVNSALRALE